MMISIRIIYKNNKSAVFRNIKLPPGWRVLVEKQDNITVVKCCTGLELFRFNNEDVVKCDIERVL